MTFAAWCVLVALWVALRPPHVHEQHDASDLHLHARSVPCDLCTFSTATSPPCELVPTVRVQPLDVEPAAPLAAPPAPLRHLLLRAPKHGPPA